MTPGVPQDESHNMHRTAHRLKAFTTAGTFLHAGSCSQGQINLDIMQMLSRVRRWWLRVVRKFSRMSPVSDNINVKNPYEAQRDKRVARNGAMLATLEVDLGLRVFASISILYSMTQHTCATGTRACRCAKENSNGRACRKRRCPNSTT